MSPAFVLIWLTCAPQIDGGACHQNRLYFPSLAACENAERTTPRDEDGLPPLVSTCAELAQDGRR